MTSAAAISKAIKQGTKVSKSTASRGRVSDVVSEGYQCRQDSDTVEVYYLSSSLGYSDQGWHSFEERQSGAIYIIAKVLKRKGYTVEKSPNHITIKRVRAGE
jgi:hypothetical protein